MTPLEMQDATFVWTGNEDLPVAHPHDAEGKAKPMVIIPEMKASGTLHCSALDYARFLCFVLTQPRDIRFDFRMICTARCSHRRYQSTTPSTGTTTGHGNPLTCTIRFIEDWAGHPSRRRPARCVAMGRKTLHTIVRYRLSRIPGPARSSWATAAMRNDSGAS